MKTKEEEEQICWEIELMCRPDERSVKEEGANKKIQSNKIEVKK